MKRFSVPRMAISLPLAVLAAAILIFINEASFQQSTSAVQNIEEAQKKREAINKLMQQMLDAETGQRGYLLTGDSKYLEPYDAAVGDLNQTLDSVRRLFEDSPEELAEFGLMSRHISRKLAEIDPTVRMRKAGQEDAWKFVLTTDVGTDQMNLIRAQASKLAAASIIQMETGQAQITKALQLSRIGIGIMALSGLLAFYMYFMQTQALGASGVREPESLQRERDLLETQVRERTATLTELATHLQNVREDERGHLGRELHDELGALLTGSQTRCRASQVAPGHQPARSFRPDRPPDQHPQQRHCAEAADRRRPASFLALAPGPGGLARNSGARIRGSLRTVDHHRPGGG